MECPKCHAQSADRSAKCKECGAALISLTRPDGQAGIDIDLGELDIEAIASDTSAVGASPSESSKKVELEILCEYRGEDDHALASPFSVVAAEDGSVRIMDELDSGTYRISMFSADGRVCKAIAELPNGPGTGEVSAPHGIALDTSAFIYIPDAGNNRIVKLKEDGTVDWLLGSEGTADNEFTFPKDVDIDSTGNIYVADSFNNRIIRFDANRNPSLVLGLCKDRDDDGMLDAGSEEGEFDEPSGVTADDAGRIYVADTNNHRVQIFDAEGALIHAFGSEGTDDGEFTFPSDIRVDKNGQICVADLSNRRLQLFTAAGAFLLSFDIAGKEGAEMTSCGDIDVDAQGHAYIPDVFGHRVIKVRLMATAEE